MSNSSNMLPQPNNPGYQSSFNLQNANNSSGFLNETAGDDDDSDTPEAPRVRRGGRRKIDIEYIKDKSRRHITFSKRKAGIMKKAYELSTLTGTQVLLLVVSETGLVYTFTTPKLQPLVTNTEGKNLIQSCLNSPDEESKPEDSDPAPNSDSPPETTNSNFNASTPKPSSSKKKQRQEEPSPVANNNNNNNPPGSSNTASDYGYYKPSYGLPTSTPQPMAPGVVPSPSVGLNSYPNPPPPGSELTSAVDYNYPNHPYMSGPPPNQYGGYNQNPPHPGYPHQYQPPPPPPHYSHQGQPPYNYSSYPVAHNPVPNGHNPVPNSHNPVPNSHNPVPNGHNPVPNGHNQNFPNPPQPSYPPSNYNPAYPSSNPHYPPPATSSTSQSNPPATYSYSHPPPS